jgi:Spy/CpxP family protein refolding chaperone
MASVDPPMRSVRLLTAVLLVATFAAGTVTGAGVCRWASPGPGHHGPPPPPGPLPFHELALTQDQSAKVHAIMELHRPELDAILRESYPKVRVVNEKIEREVQEVLTPEQRKKLDEIKARRPPPPPGPPGPGPGPSGWNPNGPPPPFGPPPGPPPDAPF